MFRFLKHFRLLLIVATIFSLIFIQLSNTMMTLSMKEALRKERLLSLGSHTAFINRLVFKELDRPFKSVIQSANNLVHADMQEVIFTTWLDSIKKVQPLVGAGFIWSKGEDKIRVFPMGIEIDTATNNKIAHYIEVKYRPEYNVHPTPFWTWDYRDSLRIVIGEKVGFSIFNYDYYHEFGTRRSRAEAIKIVFGIIWNHEYYKDHLLPETTNKIKENPRNFGIRDLRFSFSSSESVYDKIESKRVKNKKKLKDGLKWYSGVFISDAFSDTVFNYGEVDISIKDNALYHEDNFREHYGLPYRRMFRFPGWKLYVHNHFGSSKFGQGLSYRTMKPEEDNPVMEQFQLIVLTDATGKFLKNQWISLLMAIAVFFLIIVYQIRARKRQQGYIANISHELRTPITKIKLFAETLRNDRSVSKEKEDEYLDNILHTSDYLSVLIDNSLSLSRLDAGQFTVNRELKDINAWITDFYCSHKGIFDLQGFKSELNVDQNIPKVEFDSDALGLALRNIIDNSLKYFDQQKEIKIETKLASEDKIAISLKDRGLGIPKNKCKTIFRKFYRIKNQDREQISGVGLGLCIVSQIVKNHNGSVDCEPRKAGGTVFSIELPLNK